MRRRDVFGVLGGAVVGTLASHTSRAQQPAMPVVGFLYSQSHETVGDRLRGFRQGLKDAGYVEGENVAIEYRFAENQMDRLAVQHLVDVPVEQRECGRNCHFTEEHRQPDQDPQSCIDRAAQKKRSEPVAQERCSGKSFEAWNWIHVEMSSAVRWRLTFCAPG